MTGGDKQEGPDRSSAGDERAKHTHETRQARMSEIEERIRLLEAELGPAEEPVRRDLAAVGVQVSSAWDLVNSATPYPEALPILMKHLQRGGYPDRIMEGLARALAVKPMSHAWHTLRDLYLAARGPDEEAGLAAALAATATDTHVPELIALVNDDSLNDSRLLFLDPILKLGGEAGREFVESLQSDPLFGEEAGALMPSRRRRRKST